MLSQILGIVIPLIALCLLAFGAFAFVRIRALKTASVDLTARIPKPFENSFFVEVGGVRLHITRSGSGPTVLLLHGIGASTFVWRKISPELSKHFSLIAIDLAGFGYSEKNVESPHTLEWHTGLVRELTEKLNLKNFAIVGSSMGGVIALKLAECLPKKVWGLVLLAPAIYAPLAKLDWARLQMWVPLSRPFIIPTTMKLILSWVLGPGVPLDASDIEEYLLPLRDGGASAGCFLKSLQVLKQAHAIQVYEIAPNLCPLVLWGENDRVLPIGFSSRVKSSIPNAEIVRVPHGGHHPMEARPEFVNQHLVKYLNSKL